MTTAIGKARAPQEQEPALHDIAWSKRSRSNGKIIQCSRWHLSKTLVRGNETLCGKKLPFEKWFTRKPDYHVTGGECAACKKIANSNS